ncbi:MAG: hypothetical protein CMM94_02635 [Rickettsiales bacterium]|nr:hypothetical protein [Rickettsiales bacterium]|tara:strand:- start:812 stop:1291 length:480 start_codon:yes stop_codon:yes gene_type:complete
MDEANDIISAEAPAASANDAEQQDIIAKAAEWEIARNVGDVERPLTTGQTWRDLPYYQIGRLPNKSGAVETGHARADITAALHNAGFALPNILTTTRALREAAGSAPLLQQMQDIALLHRYISKSGVESPEAQDLLNGLVQDFGEQKLQLEQNPMLRGR